MFRSGESVSQLRQEWLDGAEHTLSSWEQRSKSECPGNTSTGAYAVLTHAAIALLCTRVHDACTCEIESQHFGFHSRPVIVSFYLGFMEYQSISTSVCLCLPHSSILFTDLFLLHLWLQFLT